MLDWLTTTTENQRVSSSPPQQSHESQRLIHDAPETPAPLFAYRALRAAVFGSPDHDHDEEEDEKDQDDDEEVKNVKGRRGDEKENRVASGINPGSSRVPQTPPLGKPQSSAHHNTRGLLANGNNLGSNKHTTSVSPPAQQAHNRASGSGTIVPLSPSPRKTNNINNLNTKRAGAGAGLLLSPTKSILRTPGIPTPRRQNINVTFKDIQLSVSPIAKSRLGRRKPGDDAPIAAASAHVKTAIQSTTTTAASSSSAMPPPITALLPPPPPTTSSSPSSAAQFDLDTYMRRTDREMKKLVRYGQRMRELARHLMQEIATLRQERDALRAENARLSKKLESKNQQQAEQKHAESLNPNKPEQQQDMSTTKVSWEINNPRKSRTEDENMLLVGKGLKTGEKEKERQEAQPRAADRRSVSANVPLVQGSARVTLPPDRLAAAKERLRVKSEERRRAMAVDGRENKGDAGESSQVEWQGL